MRVFSRRLKGKDISRSPRNPLFSKAHASRNELFHEKHIFGYYLRVLSLPHREVLQQIKSRWTNKRLHFINRKRSERRTVDKKDISPHFCYTQHAAHRRTENVCQYLILSCSCEQNENLVKINFVVYLQGHWLLTNFQWDSISCHHEYQLNHNHILR